MKTMKCVHTLFFELKECFETKMFEISNVLCISMSCACYVHRNNLV